MHAGFWIETVCVHVAVQPAVDVDVTVNVYDPALLAVTSTDEPVVDPLIEPLPLIAQLKLAPPSLLATVYVFPDDPEHTGSGPLIVQVGAGFTVTVFVQVLLQPPAEVVTVNVYELAAPAVTSTAEPVVEPTMVPPEIDQLKLEPPRSDETV